MGPGQGASWELPRAHLATCFLPVLLLTGPWQLKPLGALTDPTRELVQQRWASAGLRSKEPSLAPSSLTQPAPALPRGHLPVNDRCAPHDSRSLILELV